MGPLSKEQILILGAIGSAMIFFWSFAKWRTAVKVAIIMALLEGAIRKWALPQAQEIAYFLKDIFLAGAYARFFFFPDPGIRRIRVNGPIVLLAVTAAVVSLSALNPNLNSIPAAILGLKIYLFYIPMAFMMPFLFKDEKDLVRQMSWFCMFAIPICLLGALQFFSPRFSLLNVYAHEAGNLDETVYGVQVSNVASFGEQDHARITGTFSFISGMAAYLIVVTGTTLSVLTSPMVRFRVFLLAGVLPLAVANGLMSGSRSAVMGQAIVIAVMFVASFITGASGKGRGTWMVTIALGITILAVRLFFQDASTAYNQRAGSAEAKQEMRNRIVQTVGALEMGFDTGGWTGLGIGTTHPATAAVRSFLRQPNPTVVPPGIESEPTQILVELGVGGFIAWYAMRFGLCFMIYLNILRSPSGFFKNLNIFCLVFQLLHMQLQFVFNHTAQFLFWAVYGITFIPFCSILHHGRRAPPNQSANPPAGNRTSTRS